MKLQPQRKDWANLAIGKWNSERETAIQAAKQAGRILLERQGNVTVKMKGRNDPVSDADHAAQDAIRQILVRQFPDDEFVGEEGSFGGKGNGRRWIVDPLDGTINYLHGLPFWSVSIALEAAGKLVVGVVSDPVRGELFAAAEGSGCTNNGSSVQVSGVPDLASGLVCAGLPAVLEQHPRAFKVFERISTKCFSIRRLGSAALALAYVAAGRAESFWGYNVQSWDVAAGAVLVAQAGGLVTSFDPKENFLDTKTIIGSNGLVHRELAAEIAAVA